jgi:5'-deoxynucleotidase YfbR-like HD superfamily hydrolase
VLERLLWKLPSITDTEARYLKLADLLEGAAFCLSELRRGNRDICHALGNYLRYIATMHPEGTAGEIFNFIKEQAHEYGFKGE